MNAIGFLAKHYCRPFFPDLKDESDEFVVAQVLESTLPFTKVDPKTGEVKDVSLSHNNFFGYLIVQEAGYWARNKNNYNKQKGNQNNLLPKHPAAYNNYSKTSITALYDLANNWDGKPFLVLEMGRTQFDFNRFQLSCDLRHVIINTSKNNIILDATFLLKLKEEEVA